MSERPDYCPCENEQPDPCPACGASVATGWCKARYNRRRPEPLVELVLIDKRTGEIVR